MSTTACPGRAGAPRRWVTRVPRSSTITSKPVAEGGLCFRARFGVERRRRQSARRRQLSGRLRDPGRLSGVHHGHAQGAWLGWRSDRRRTRLRSKPSPATRPTGRPTFRAASSGSRSSMAARPSATPRPVPWCGTSRIRCRSTASRSTPPADLVSDYPTYADKQAYRLPTLYESIQKKDFSGDFPIVMTSGRLVEYEGGGDESRSNPWLAELQQDMFVEINPFDANEAASGTASMVWVHSPRRAPRSRSWPWSRNGSAAAWPSCRSTSPGTCRAKIGVRSIRRAPIPMFLAKPATRRMTYGYDSVTQMQESKVTLARIEPA